MKRVLIIDDAMFMRHTLRVILEKNEYEVVGEAGDGPTGILKFKELSPDIVTMDITMPEMDGITAIREIKKVDPEAKIVVISAMGQQTSIMEAIAAGAQRFIVKPFKDDIVLKTLGGM